MRSTLLALSVLLGALPAVAQERPPIEPTRDVAVTYRILGSMAGQDSRMRMAWLAAQGLQRSDMPGGMGGWMLLDRRAGRGFMVLDDQRMVMQTPDIRQQIATYGEPGPNARITREGTDRVANTACNVWRVEDQGQSSRICVTADGVMLRAIASNPRQPGQEGGVEAVAVEYGPQDPARFRVPAGYQTMQMPMGMPMGAPAGGRAPGK